MKFLFVLSLFMVSAASAAEGRKLVINDIQITGNHTTRKNVILRELTFQKGDTILNPDLENKLSRSRENILNTSLFNYVTIEQTESDPDYINITIIVEERWYTWPYLILKYEDRNFSAWVKSRDLSKSKYGFSINQNNCFGRRETLKFSLLFGYAKQFDISYRNIALDKDRKHVIGASVDVIRQDETIFKTNLDEPVDFKSSFHSVFESKKYTVNYSYRPQINDFHNFYLNYFQYHISDTILKLNPGFLPHNQNNLRCLNLDYIYSKDLRDSKAYPLRGSYFELFFGQTVSLPFSRSSFTSIAVIPNYYRFIEISNRIYYALNVNLKLSYNNSYSYYFSRSLGYIYNLHGFEYNTIEGQHFITFSNLVKFALLKPKTTELSFIPLSKFRKIYYAVYFNIFADCGYVADKYHMPGNTYPNRFLCSTGAGLDLVTYYDLTFRVDYSLNGFGKTGFYFHVTAPINKQ